MKNKMTDLRDHLFAELEELRDSDKPFNAERTKAIIGVAQVLVDSAKVEVAFLSNVPVAAQAQGTGFLPAEHVPSQRQLRAG